MTYIKENPGAAVTKSEASNNNTPRKHADKKNNSAPKPIQDNSQVSKPIKEKLCVRCNKFKKVSEFRRNNKTEDGYIKTCFACCKPKKSLKSSYKQAVFAKCRECIYDPIAGGGGWIKQVTACTSPECPLFDVRPRPEGHNDG